MNLRKWTHPKTGEARIYINGAAFQKGAKMWVEKTEDKDIAGCDWDVKVFADWAMDKRQARDAAENDIEKMIGHGCTFDQIAAAAQ